ncbi:SAC1 [Candida pseudojiufengensis]|uniref:SAC1 n=1 Tax=Candida pseudojiufengensis TaxID=497109 RepID=UPI0022257819|nr:SAC1 [Candida pseudojiufengensis]KAI5963659.1 SAC1 [Candida pseudojiufengensis]
MVLTHSINNDGTHVFHNNLTNTYLILSNNSTEITKELPSNYNNSKFQPISCIIGIIKLKINSYVIIGDKHSITGTILGNEIAFIESFKIYPLVNNANLSSEEKKYLELINKQLKNSTLYYSINNQYDLTNSLQKQFTSEIHNLDDRFWWNKYLSAPLIDIDLNYNFITPIIYGYFKSHQTIFNNKSLQFALLTRRSTSRAGTRYFRRGIDLDGNVANFNETEQIFTSDNNHLYSILQTRGSVPVYWAEVNNLKYKPNLEISTQSSLEATEKHFNQQVELYGDNYLVNLVNQNGYEKPVKLAYENAINNLPQQLKQHIHYIYFDFHHECKGMKFHKINKLLDHLINLGYTSDNYFEIDLTTKKILNVQKAIVRTNCMDCLDRTNVVQSMIGRWFLQNQLLKTGYLSSVDQSFAQIDPKFNLFFQNFWADNADAVSCAYSGTGALKTDFTRLGKRTYQGGFQDLINSITRYYKNNLSDGSRQDSYDLFLGKFKPYQDAVISPFKDNRPPIIQLLPYLMGTSILILLALFYYPKGSLLDYKNLIFIALVVLFNYKSFSYILSNGYQYVDWPKLVPLDYLKKQYIYNNQGKIIGTKYEKTDYFKGFSKKSK